MEITIKTGRPGLIGHVRENDEERAMCGAPLVANVDSRRYVCGKCVALLIEDRNAVNDLLDLADMRQRRLRERYNTLLDEHDALLEQVESGSQGDEPEGDETPDGETPAVEGQDPPA